MLEIILVIAGFVLGAVTNEYINLSKKNKPVVKKTDEVMFSIEQHNSQYFAYSTEDDSFSFLAQGKSFTELFDNIHIRFPDNTFTLKLIDPSFTTEQIDELATAFVNRMSLPLPETENE